MKTSPKKQSENVPFDEHPPRNTQDYLINRTEGEAPLNHNDLTVTVIEEQGPHTSHGHQEIGDHRALLLDNRPSDVKQADIKNKMEDLNQSIKQVKRHKEQINTPKQFLKNVAFSIQLSDLLKVKACCSYHQGHQYAGVLIEVVHEELKGQYEGNYLMQVWSNEGKLFYSRPLNFIPISMNIFDDVFLFVTDPRDNNESLSLTVVNLLVEGSVLTVEGLIADQSFKHLGYNKDHLFVASQRDIKAIVLQTPLAEMEGAQNQQVVAEEITSVSITPTLNIHGFFMNQIDEQDCDHCKILCFIELEDNQMSTQIIELNEGRFIFTPYREYFLRENSRQDPILDFKFIVKSDGVLYSIALRKSGIVDLYFNNTPVGESNQQFQDIEITYGDIFARNANLNAYKISIFNPKSRVTFEAAEDMETVKNRQWDMIGLDKIKTHLKMFSSILLGRRSFIASHANFVSIYDLILNKWVQHFAFDANIHSILKDTEEYGQQSIFIVLESGKVELARQQFSSEDSSWVLEEEGQQIEGTIGKIVSDFVTLQHHFIMSKNNEEKHIYYLFSGTLYKATFDEMLEGDEIVKFQREGTENPELLLWNSSNRLIRICSAHLIFDQIEQTNSCNLKIEKSYQLEDEQILPEASEIMLCAFRTDDQDRLIVFTRNELRVVEPDTPSATPEGNTEGQNVKYAYVQKSSQKFSSCTLIDDEYLYVIQDRQEKVDQGFYVRNLDQMLTKQEGGKTEFSFKLKSALGSQSDMLIYYESEERIAYQSDFQTVKIVPILHLNVMTFFGMQKREEYLAFKRTKDQFIALDKHLTLTTWNVTSGKLLNQTKVKEGSDFGIQEYSIFSGDNGLQDDTYFMGWYQNRVLLVHNNDEEEVDRKEFFGARYREGINNSSSPLDSTKIYFRRFKVIEIVDSFSFKEHYNFVHSIFRDQYLRLYTSDDHQHMLEIQSNDVVFLYEKQDIGDNKVRWNLVRKLLYFSSQICSYSNYNYLFSPNLLMYLDYSKTQNAYQIKCTKTQETLVTLNQGFITPQTDNPEHLVKRFQWVSNTVFKFINFEGFEKVFDLTEALQDKSKQAKVVSEGNVLMIDIQKCNKAEKMHFYSDQTDIKSRDQCLPRLLRQAQNFYSVSKTILPGGKKSPLYDVIYSVDYNCPADEKILIEMSFTYLHWKLADDISKGYDDYDIWNLSNPQLQILCLNIFPGGNTALHLFHDSHNPLKVMYENVRNYANELCEIENSVPFFIPFIKNFEDQSPLHLTLKAQNLQVLNTLMGFLKEDTIDNHSAAIVDIIPEILETGIPTIGEYLTARFKETSSLSNGLKKGTLKIVLEDSDFQVHTSQLWPDIQALKNSAFTHSKGQQLIETELKATILDLPGIHSFKDENSKEFFNSLAKIENIHIFENVAIRALIDYKWPLIKEYTIKILFIPFLFYIVTFIIFSNIFNGQYVFDGDDQDTQREQYHNWKMVLIALLYAFSIFSLSNEIVQLYRQGFLYFESVWNFLDIILPVLVSVVISYHVAEWRYEDYIKPTFLCTVHSLCSLFCWLKFFYFLRIFKRTGYLIRMLNTVVYDMRIFLLILLIIYMAFGEAFLRLSEGSSEEAAWIPTYGHAMIYAFRLSLGDNDTDTYDDSIQRGTAWILFVACILYTNIVMLNLLIAIISLSFEKINGNAEQASYQERARLISENNYLIPNRVKVGLSQNNSYLIAIKEVNESQKAKGDEPPPAAAPAETTNSSEPEFTALETTLSNKLAEVKTQLNDKMTALDLKMQQILSLMTDKAPKINLRPTFGHSNTIARKDSVESLAPDEPDFD